MLVLLNLFDKNLKRGGKCFNHRRSNCALTNVALFEPDGELLHNKICLYFSENDVPMMLYLLSATMKGFIKYLDFVSID